MKGDNNMKRISIDNGATYTTPEEALQVFGLEDLAEYMEDDAREETHRQLAPCTDADFLRHYLVLAKHDLIIG